MVSHLLHFDVGPFELVIRGAVVYLFILVLLRLAGKRQMGQMSPTDFVAMLLISNAVQNSMNGGDNSLSAGIVLAVVLIALGWAISVLTYRNVWFRRVFEGSPSLLIHDGKLVQKNLDSERVTRSELRSMLRRQGIHQLSDVKAAVLESDGTLSVTKYSDLRDSELLTH